MNSRAAIGSFSVPRATHETGVVFIRLRQAALCCEETCEAIFDHGSDGPGETRCPGCGGATWVPLTSFVAPIAFAAERADPWHASVERSVPSARPRLVALA